MNRVRDFYNQDPEVEWRRLDENRTEFAVTLKALSDVLPAAPAAILDIGGGPGRYAIALAQQGYTVTLADLAEANLAFAQQAVERAGAAVSEFLVADARDLSMFTSESFDGVLLLGPLYHLLEEADRQAALAESRRVLKTGGVIAAAFLCRFAPLRFAAQRLPEWITHNADRMERILTTGRDDEPKTFTHAYLSRPEEIEPVMRAAGFEMCLLVGCEGVTAGHAEAVNRSSGSVWEQWVDLNYRLGRDPAMHGASDHLLYMGRKTV